jgi:hypothetical protein
MNDRFFVHIRGSASDLSYFSFGWLDVRRCAHELRYREVAVPLDPRTLGELGVDGGAVHIPSATGRAGLEGREPGTGDQRRDPFVNGEHGKAAAVPHVGRQIRETQSMQS